MRTLPRNIKQWHCATKEGGTAPEGLPAHLKPAPAWALGGHLLWGTLSSHDSERPASCFTESRLDAPHLCISAPVFAELPWACFVTTSLP